MPASARRSVYRMETYWLPLSLWCIRPSMRLGCRACSACFQGIQNEVCSHPVAHPPANDSPGKDIDHEGDVEPALPR